MLRDIRLRLITRINNNPVFSLIKMLISDSFVYLTGAVLLGLGNFVLVPLYTRYLYPAQFGVYSIIDITILFIVVAAQLGFGVTYLKKYSEEGEINRGELLGTMLAVSSAMAILGGGIFSLTIASSFGANWLQTKDIGFAWLLMPIIVLETSQGLLLSDLRARRKPFLYSLATVTRLLLMVGASLWLIVDLKMGLTGVFLGRLAGDAGSVLVLSFSCLLSTRLRISYSLAVPMLKYGFPLVGSALIAMLLDASGRYFLNHFNSIEQVGYYGVAIKISAIFQMLVVQPFGIAWGGLMFQIVKWQNAKRIYSKIAEYLFLVSSSIALIISIFTPNIFHVFATKDYDLAMGIFPLILLVRVINIMEYPTSIGLYLKGKTGIFPLIYLIGLLVNIVINYCLVPIIGMYGSGLAWLGAWLIIVISMVVIGQRHYSLPYNFRSFLIPVLLWVIIQGILSIPAINLSPKIILIQIGLSIFSLTVVGLFFLVDIRKYSSITRYKEI